MSKRFSGEGNPFYGKTHTLEVRTKIATANKSYVGTNAKNWRGGTSLAYQTGYYSLEYKDWRRRVFERDGYCCQECGACGFVTAHHIKSFAHYPELRFELTNGKTLCEDCHKKTDNYKGRSRQTKTNQK